MIKRLTNAAALVLCFSAGMCFGQGGCSRSSGSPIEMQVWLVLEEPANSDQSTEKIGTASAANDPTRESSSGSRSNNFTTNMQIRVELQDNFGSSLKDSSPGSEGKVVFNVCSRNIYRVRVTGAEIEEATADNVSPGSGDRVVNLTLHRKGSHEDKKKHGKGMVAATRLNIPRAAQKELDRGDAALTAGNLAQAREHFKKAIADYPQFDQAYNNLGVVLMQSGEPAKGKAAFEKAIELNPHFPRALSNLARIDLDEKRYPEGLALVQKSLASEPLNVNTLFLGVETAYFSQKFSDAIDYARKLHMLPHAGKGLAHFLCAKSLEKQDLKQQAIAEYQMFLNEDPKDPNVPQAEMAIAELQAGASVPQ